LPNRGSLHPFWIMPGKGQMKIFLKGESESGEYIMASAISWKPF